MLQNAKFVVFTVSELFWENQRRGGEVGVVGEVKLPPTRPSPFLTQIMIKRNCNWWFLLVFSFKCLLCLNQYFIYEEWVEIIYFSGVDSGISCENLWRQHYNFFSLIFYLECWLLYFCFKVKKFSLYLKCSTT